MIAGIAKSILLSIGIAWLTQSLLDYIQSDFIHSFLKSNITNIQIALLAINATTLGIVLSKIREIIDELDNKTAFDDAKKEMLLSIKEQVALIATSLVIISIETAKNPNISSSPAMLETLLIASFIYSIMILYDTAKSVFVILDY